MIVLRIEEAGICVVEATLGATMLIKVADATETPSVICGLASGAMS